MLAVLPWGGFRAAGPFIDPSAGWGYDAAA